MSITVSHVTKRFGDFVALDDVSRAHPRRAAHRAARAERRRQVDAAAHHRRAGGRRRRARSRSRASTPPGWPPRSATSASCSSTTPRSSTCTVARNVAFGLEIRKPSEGRDPRAGTRAARAGAPRAVRRPPPVAALGWAAPADGARPRARRRADGAAARRAVRRARRQGAQGAARLAAPPPRRGARDDGVRHPRPGGGARGRRRDRGDQRGSCRADRHAGRSCTTSRPTTS